mmetsp:Transcript_5061/g.10673  ORF Transcript_5061/g.10673 Transcript_5061/m.10673 type:complete len:344 (+) Transcript_5061:131-1162(+)
MRALLFVLTVAQVAVASPSPSPPFGVPALNLDLSGRAYVHALSPTPETTTDATEPLFTVPSSKVIPSLRIGFDYDLLKGPLRRCGVLGAVVEGWWVLGRDRPLDVLMAAGRPAASASTSVLARVGHRVRDRAGWRSVAVRLDGTGEAAGVLQYRLLPRADFEMRFSGQIRSIDKESAKKIRPDPFSIGEECWPGHSGDDGWIPEFTLSPGGALAASAGGFLVGDIKPPFEGATRGPRGRVVAALGRTHAWRARSRLRIFVRHRLDWELFSGTGGLLRSGNGNSDEGWKIGDTHLDIELSTTDRDGRSYTAVATRGRLDLDFRSVVPTFFSDAKTRIIRHHRLN